MPHRALLALPLLLAVLPLMAGPAHAARPASRFTVVVSVSPSAMPYNAYPTLYAHTRIGAVCVASVLYLSGRRPVSFAGYAQKAGRTGIVGWSWHEETKSAGGTGTVSCTWKGQTATGSTDFSVG